MQTSSQPKLLPVPFADNGVKQSIPTQSQIGIVAGRASYNDGFPPLTRTALAAGGVPPFGTDFNGVLNDITAAVRWAQAGAGYPYDASFNTTISGYPKGARLPSSTFDGFWLNTQEGNVANPESSSSALTGWVPSFFYGVTSISGLSGSSVTLTTLQAGRERLVLDGALTANINMIVPAWVKRWEIVNNCTGNFNVIVKTPSGSGVAVGSGKKALVYGDGANIVDYGYLQATNALSEISALGSSAVASAQSNLGLGNAATKNVGTGSNQIPDMSYFASSTGATGYQKFPSGLILQWGFTNPSPNNTNNTVAFPASFPQRCNGVTLQYVNSGIVNNPAQGTPHQVGVYTRLGFDFYYAGSASGMQHFWYAWGY